MIKGPAIWRARNKAFQAKGEQRKKAKSCIVFEEKKDIVARSGWVSRFLHGSDTKVISPISQIEHKSADKA